MDKSNSRARKDFLVFGNPLIEEESIQEVVKTLRSGWIGTGPRVQKFEEMFRSYKRCSYAVAVNSGTAALHLSLLALNLKPGDEVVTTPMTFCATINAILHAGATPVFSDCERTTFNLDPAQLESKITSRTKAILPVHFAGRPCQMDAIMDIARKHGLAVVEDCAHAIEAEYKGRTVGTFGDLGCFSFYVTKNLTTAEGGMVITNNRQFAERIKILALHGMSHDAWKRFQDSVYKSYPVVAAGFKYNMTDIQAALGLPQIPRLDGYWRRRQEIWKRYNAAFKDLPCLLPPDSPSAEKHAYHLYTILLDIHRVAATRDQVLQRLAERNIGTGVHYTALHLHPYYASLLGYKSGDFPNAEFISERTFSLPLSPKLSDQDVDDTIHAVGDILA